MEVRFDPPAAQMDEKSRHHHLRGGDRVPCHDRARSHDGKPDRQTDDNPPSNSAARTCG